MTTTVLGASVAVRNEITRVNLRKLDSVRADTNDVPTRPCIPRARRTAGSHEKHGQVAAAGCTDFVMKENIRPATRVSVDPEPDERGNVLAMALIEGGRMVALMLNAN